VSTTQGDTDDDDDNKTNVGAVGVAVQAESADEAEQGMFVAQSSRASAIDSVPARMSPTCQVEMESLARRTRLIGTLYSARQTPSPGPLLPT
jgi:hypothetical protein